MSNDPRQLMIEMESLRAQLDEAKETLRVIHSGEVDALFVSGEGVGSFFTFKDANQSYRLLIEEMSEGALIMSAEGMILYANRRFAGMLKMPLEKVIGAAIHTRIAPASKRIFQALLNKGVNEKRRDQLDLIASDGTFVSVYLSVSNLPVNESTDSFFLVATDVTEEKRNQDMVASQKLSQELLAAANQSRRALLSVIEDQKQAEEDVRKLNSELEAKVIARTEELNQARSSAELANRAKSEFLATMSHEIRTPMNGVIGMIDVLQQSSLNPQQMEMSNIIHDSAYALLAIIEDILDFSKIEAGKLQIESLPMNITDVVEGVCETMDHLARGKKVKLTMFTDPFLPTQVMGDPGRLRQILINLVNNAIKFSSGQSRQARVSVRAMRGALIAPNNSGVSEEITVEFLVSDNGIGIDAASEARLFIPFNQADSSTTRKFGGTGLGLAICRQLVNIKGGEISVQSEPDKGAVFTVRLPFALPEEKPETNEQSPSLAGLCCLVAGSTASQAGDMATYLAHDGALVERVVDREAARQWIATRPPGLCVVVIDTLGTPLPVDELRTAAYARIGTDIRFVVIGSGKRRRCRIETADQVTLDGEVMHRKLFLEAVAIAAGRIKEPIRSNLPIGTGPTPLPLSREEARLRGNLILVAEDNEINQKVILHQLRLLGHTADITNNGREALEFWQQGYYGMLITDLHMPEMDGYDLTASIRASESVVGKTPKPRIPIIAFTANALKGEAERCFAIGMDAYLSKPVQLFKLKETLDKWLPIMAEATPVEINPDLSERSEITEMSLAHEGKNNRDQGLLKQPVTSSPVSASMPIDVNVLKALVGDDRATIAEFLHDFRISAEKIATELRTACAAGQTKAAGDAAHKLKSSARSVGALALGELCEEMELAGKAKQTLELAALLSRFEAEISVVNNYLDSLQPLSP